MKKHIADGSALEKFRELIIAQNGDASCIEDYSQLPQASIVQPVLAEKAGYLKRIKTFELALGCKILGAGREQKTDSIDYSVGVVLNKKVGEKIEVGEKLLDIHANSPEKLKNAEKLLSEAFVISEEKVSPEPVVEKKVSKVAEGYEIQYSTDSKFITGVKTVTVSKAKTVSSEVKKLKSNTAYYVRIRAYGKDGKTKTYSAWTSVKSAVKTK